MPAFVCEKCGCIENTAISMYWVRDKGSPALCSACDPKLKKWHNCFPRRKATKKDKVLNPEAIK